MDVGAWLERLGLHQYAQAFAENDIDGEALRTLDAEDLKELGVTSLGHRKRLLAAITELGADEGPAPGPRAAPEGERRQVTVLFADLVDYTRLSSELDAEEIHELLDRFFEHTDGVIESFGGTIDKHIGDCVMGVFGAPIAHGNDAERAVLAALAIQNAMPTLSQEIGQSLAVHVGIAAGQVVASDTGSPGRKAYTVTGDSVNLASRLTDRAGAGQTLISDAVRRALPDRFESDVVGEVSVKGLAEPVRAWRLLGLGETPQEHARPFVGRRSELHQFEGVLRATRETGWGQAVHVRGEAGIGKSCLVGAFQGRAVAAGFVCHSGAVLDFGTGAGRDAIRSIVRSLLDVSGADRDALEERAERAQAEGLLAAERRVFLNDLLDLPQPIELRALNDAMDNATRNAGKRDTVAELVTTLSRRQPLLLVVEDVHWADPLAMDHLARLTGVVSGCPALLVMTSRVEGDPLTHAWRIKSGGSPLMTIDLGPLREDEASVLAGAYMDATSAFARRCLERAAGNPLFLEQLLRHAEERAEVAVPGSVQSLVQARLDQLAPDDKQALQAASILGQQFSPAALAHLLGRSGFDCARLVEHFLVRPQGEDFLFAHALIRDAVYDSLLRTRRRELHRRAAAWFAERDFVLHAEHLDRADDPAAAMAHLAAARAEARHYRYERALRLAERGLEVAGDDSDRFKLSVMRADLLRLLGQPAASIEAFEAALRLSEDETERCEAWIGIAAGTRLLGDPEKGVEVLGRAEEVASRQGLDPALARIHYYSGSLAYAGARVEECLAHHRQALAHAERAGDPEWAALALSGLGDGEYARGRMRASIEHYRHCLALVDEHGLGQIDVANRYQLGSVMRYLNETDAGFQQVVRAAEMAAKVGNPRAEMVARMLEGEFLVDRAETTHAEGPLARSYALAESLGNDRFRAYLRNQQARRLLYEGRVEQARALLQEGLEISRRTDPRFIGPRLLGTFALVSEDDAEREQALRDGEAILRSGCNVHNWLWFYRDAIEASLGSADWAGAERHAEALETFTRQEPLPWSDFFIARGRTLAAHGAGRRDGPMQQELRRLQGQAEAVGLSVALPALQEALATCVGPLMDRGR